MKEIKTTKKEIAICIFAYNRLEHLKITISNLLANDLTMYDLFIFQDGPKCEKDRLLTSSVMSFIDEIDKSTFIRRVHLKQNIGLANSIFNGLDFIFEHYNQAIILEDDILIRPGFLNFLTSGLEQFSDDKKVAGISGFSYLDKPLKTSYFLPIGCSWGWATWKRVWNDVKRDPLIYKKEIDRLNLKSKFDFGTYPFYDILENAVLGKNDSWAINFYASFFLRNQMFLFPNISLCENLGFDGSGTHTKSTQVAFNSKNDLTLLSSSLPTPELSPPIIKKLKLRMKNMASGRRPNILQRYLGMIIHGR